MSEQVYVLNKDGLYVYRGIVEPWISEKTWNDFKRLWDEKKHQVVLPKKRKIEDVDSWIKEVDGLPLTEVQEMSMFSDKSEVQAWKCWEADKMLLPSNIKELFEEFLKDFKTDYERGISSNRYQNYKKWDLMSPSSSGLLPLPDRSFSKEELEPLLKSMEFDFVKARQDLDRKYSRKNYYSNYLYLLHDALKIKVRYKGVWMVQSIHETPKPFEAQGNQSSINREWFEEKNRQIKTWLEVRLELKKIAQLLDANWFVEADPAPLVKRHWNKMMDLKVEQRTLSQQVLSDRAFLLFCPKLNGYLGSDNYFHTSSQNGVLFPSAKAAFKKGNRHTNYPFVAVEVELKLKKIVHVNEKEEIDTGTLKAVIAEQEMNDLKKMMREFESQESIDEKRARLQKELDDLSNEVQRVREKAEPKVEPVKSRRL